MRPFLRGHKAWTKNKIFPISIEFCSAITPELSYARGGHELRQPSDLARRSHGVQRPQLGLRQAARGRRGQRARVEPLEQRDLSDIITNLALRGAAST